MNTIIKDLIAITVLFNDNIYENVIFYLQELSRTYITPENIDEAIEKALSTEKDFDYSIDLDGNIYPGRNSKAVAPEIKDYKKIEEASV